MTYKANVSAKAKEPFVASVLLNPVKSNVFSYCNRGLAKNDVKDFHGAISDFSKTIEIDLGNSDSYCHSGISKLGLGDMPEACQDWKKASELGNAAAKGWLSRFCDRL